MGYGGCHETLLEFLPESDRSRRHDPDQVKYAGRHDDGLDLCYVEVFKPELFALLYSVSHIAVVILFEHAARELLPHLAHKFIIATPMEEGLAKRINWKSIGTYYVIACLWSWPFLWRRDVLHIRETSLPIHWALMWGPGMAALVCMAMFRRSHRRIITIFGDSWSRSMLFYAAPFLIFALFRAHPLNGYNHRPLIAALPMFVSIFRGRLGWRGFLQDALRSLPPLKRFGLIGVLWELWHITTHIHGRIFVVLVLFYSLAILLSFAIGYPAEYSHSIIVAVSLHA